MSALHLAVASVSLPAMLRWGEERGLTRLARRRGRAVVDEGLILHHLVRETFGPGALQPFRLLAARGEEAGHLYGYSALEAGALRESAQAIASPLALRAIGLERLASKPMPNGWRAGQRMGFDVRVLPTRRSSRAEAGGDGRRSREFDAFDGAGPRPQGRESAYLDWLAERLAPAAALERDSCRLAAHRRRPAVRGRRLIPSSEAVIQGTLAITDPPAFSALLAAGVGRHRSYGYGMVLLRAPAPE